MLRDEDVNISSQCNMDFQQKQTMNRECIPDGENNSV